MLDPRQFTLFNGIDKEIRAALSGDREDIRHALEAHPLVGGRLDDVDPLLDALLEANHPYLAPAAGRE